MDDSALAELRRLLAATPDLAAVLHKILDRREATGRLPQRITVFATAACAGALRGLLSARAVRAAGDGRLRLELAGLAGLDDLLYRSLGRGARDPAAEERALRSGLDALLAEAAASAGASTSRSWLAAGRADPAELLVIAQARGLDAAAHEIHLIVRAIDAALTLDGPLRLANFSARALGDSKLLLPGSERLRRIGLALYQHHPGVRADVEADGETVSALDAAVRALETCGVTRDEGALSVLCFGPLVYVKRGQRFDHVARHADLGDASRLTLAQLRHAELVELPVERVTVLENRTPFLDYIEVLAAQPERPRELVVCSEGQAGWATVTLLRHVARARLGVPCRHAGDLDRSGVLILRSLARRSGLPLAPHLMDVATHRRFADRGLPLRADEAGKLHGLLATDAPDAVGRDLLVEIARTGRWLEQESFSHEALLPGAIHGRSATTGV